MSKNRKTPPLTPGGENINDRCAIEKIEEVIGYRFSDKSLLIQAFTRASYVNEFKGKTKDTDKPQSNEVLEFFGDAVLGAALVTVFSDKYTKRYRYGIKSELSEGELTAMKSRLSDKKNLSQCIMGLGLGKYLLMSEGDKNLRMQREASVAEDLFESIVGAVYIDSGKNIDVATDVVQKLLGASSALNSTPAKSYKNLLQEWCESPKRRLPLPEYRETKPKSGPDHDPVYTVSCFVNGREIATAQARSVKYASAAAAEKAYKILASDDGDSK